MKLYLILSNVFFFSLNQSTCPVLFHTRAHDCHPSLHPTSHIHLSKSCFLHLYPNEDQVAAVSKCRVRHMRKKDPNFMCTVVGSE